MSKKIFLSVLILCVFVAFLALKLKSLYEPPKANVQLSAHYLETVGAQESFYGIYIQNVRVGRLKRLILPTRTGYKIVEEARMNIRFLEEKSELAMNLLGDVDEQFRLRNFLFQIQSGKDPIDIKGDLQNGSVVLTVLTRGKSNTYTIPMREAPVLASGIIPYLVKKGFSEGGAISVPVFDPSTLTSYDATVNLLGWEKVKVEGEEVRAFHLKTVFKGIEVHGWVDEVGSIVKELSPLGLTIQKEKTGKPATDFFDARLFSSVETTGKIEHPRSTTSLTVRVQGKEDLKRALARYHDVKDDLVLVSTERSVRLDIEPAKYLAASAFVNSDDAQIRGALRSILGDRRSDRAKVAAIQEWVHRTVRKTPTFSLPTAKDVFVKKAGDCNEHAVLFAALARAAGIPCAIVSGMVYAADGFYYHAWNLVYLDGRWIPVDSTFGQFPADATHITLAVGDISDAVDIMQFLRNIRITVVEAG